MLDPDEAFLEEFGERLSGKMNDSSTAMLSEVMFEGPEEAFQDVAGTAATLRR